MHDVLKLHLPCNERYIFYNDDKAIDHEYLRNMGICNRSLMLIRPEFVSLVEGELMPAETATVDTDTFLRVKLLPDSQCNLQDRII